jgi:hypothetical protein
MVVPLVASGSSAKKLWGATLASPKQNNVKEPNWFRRHREGRSKSAPRPPAKHHCNAR